MRFNPTILFHPLVLVLLVTFSIGAHAKPVAVGGYDYPPFMYQQDQSGVYVDLLQAISNVSGLVFEWEFYPYARLDKLFEHGVIHLEIGSSPIWTQNKTVPGLYSDSFYTLKDVAVFRQGEQSPIESGLDIKGKKIGVVRGYGFPQFQASFDSGQAQRFDAVNELQLLDMLANKRLNQILINKELFLYHQKNNAQYQNLVFGDVVGSYEIGIRIQPEQQHLLKPLNRAIELLKGKGVIEEIVMRYLKQ